MPGTPLPTSRPPSPMLKATAKRVRTLPRPADAPWLSPKEAAAYVGLGVDSIYDACASRGLRHVKLGHSTMRIRREWLDTWMTSQAQGGETPGGEGQHG